MTTRSNIHSHIGDDTELQLGVGHAVLFGMDLAVYMESEALADATGTAFHALALRIRRDAAIREQAALGINGESVTL
jgi:hypothetical protein